MTMDREAALRSLSAGDIFHARSPNGASMVCLVTEVDEGTIYARRIHTQDDEQFDRKTGYECGKDHTKIDCAAPLPPEIYDIFVGLDRRYQAQMELVRKGFEPDMMQARYTPDERHAHGVLDKNIKANPI
jgi:hypothetical protein